MCKLGEKPLINAGGGKGCLPQTRMRGLRSAQACCGAQMLYLERQQHERSNSKLTQSYHKLCDKVSGFISGGRQSSYDHGYCQPYLK